MSVDHFIKHTLRVRGYIRYMDDLLLLGPEPEVLFRLRDAIASYLHTNLGLFLHPGKEHLAKARQGISYLGYRVYPQYLHVSARNVRTLKARLDFFKHLFRPRCFPLCQKPVRGIWQNLAENGLAPPVRPDWVLLKRMEATINSYYGIMGHAQSHTLRKRLYHEHFGPLRSFFLPADADYSAVHVVRRHLYQ